MTDEEIIELMMKAINDAAPCNENGMRLQLTRDAVTMQLAAIRAYDAAKKFGGNPDPLRDEHVERLALQSLQPGSEHRPGCAAVIAPGEWIDSAGNVRHV